MQTKEEEQWKRWVFNFQKKERLIEQRQLSVIQVEEWSDEQRDVGLDQTVP